MLNEALMDPWLLPQEWAPEAVVVQEIKRIGIIATATIR